MVYLAMLYVCFIYIRTYTPYRSYSKIYIFTDRSECSITSFVHISKLNTAPNTHTHTTFSFPQCAVVSIILMRLCYTYMRVCFYTWSGFYIRWLYFSIHIYTSILSACTNIMWMCRGICA